ncbi:MAG: large conductance mechanosensitive channel protein MscL [Pseudobdellovibrionaceae bacterium]
MFKEFREFIARGNVMDMAVGIIMGAAFTAIVNSAVGDVIMPVIGMATSGIDFADKFIALDGGDYASLDAAKAIGAPVITYGVFVDAVINFLIVSFCVFMLIKGVNSLKRKAEDPNAKDTPPPAADIVLLTEIRDALKGKSASVAAKPAVAAAPVVKAPAPAAAKPAKKKNTAKKAAKKKAPAKPAATQAAPAVKAAAKPKTASAKKPSAKKKAAAPKAPAKK